MLVSNMVFGQGPWTPWQMFSMGLVGFSAGLVFNNSKIRGEQLTRLSLCVFGGFCCIIIYGGIMNPASVIMWQPTVNLQMIIAASAHKTATVTRSLADTFRVSYATPNGIIISIKTKSEIK